MPSLIYGLKFIPLDIYFSVLKDYIIPWTAAQDVTPHALWYSFKSRNVTGAGNARCVAVWLRYVGGQKWVTALPVQMNIWYAIWQCAIEVSHTINLKASLRYVFYIIGQVGKLIPELRGSS